jgi:deazaflavin-dependent oxidoreductase (nitroreductase family)
MGIANGIVAGLLRSPLHRVLSGSTDLIRYTGRRSGRQFVTPTQYAQRGDDLIILVGRPESKAWWRNFRTDGDIDVLVRGRWVPMTAKAVIGSEDPTAVAPLLDAYVTRFPRAARMLGGADTAAGAGQAVVVWCRPAPEREVRSLAAARVPPRWFVRTFWLAHRSVYRLTRGRLGLWRPKPNGWGAMRLTTVGRRSGRERSVMVGYFEDGPNLVTMAMNGWSEGEPAWWLNLQAHPEARADLPDGPVLVTGRAAVGEERERLWAQWREIDKDLDAFAARRSGETAVVVLEPRSSWSADTSCEPTGPPPRQSHRKNHSAGPPAATA